jgi:NAD(P)-dependent dehydrogenase (short-subunit alcohol dehydrogenase family)
MERLSAASGGGPDLGSRVAAVTGGGGVLCSVMAHGLAAVGARVAVLALRDDASQRVVEGICAAGGEAIAVEVDVLERASVQAACDQILAAYGSVDIRINGAEGNKA